MNYEWMVNDIKIDREYASNWAEEVKFLSQNGIKYSFVKTVDDVTVWKYKKNEMLFSLLSKFYANVYTTKA